VYLAISGVYLAAGMVLVAGIAGLFISQDDEPCAKIFNDALVRQIRDVLLKASSGNLSERITNIFPIPKPTK
jgi:hypothetical protein